MRRSHPPRTALITGANHGIGLALTHRLLNEGWEVISLIRSAFAEDDPLIHKALGSRQLRIYKADLSDFGQLRSALQDINRHESHIDILFNNAGGSFPELLLSKQGRELHYELQTVVPYILTMELKPLLLKGTLRTVVNTSSNAFMMKRSFDPASLERPAKFQMLTGPYADTKRAMSLWTEAVASELAAEGILIRSADPGGNNTLRSGKNQASPSGCGRLRACFSRRQPTAQAYCIRRLLANIAAGPGCSCTRTRSRRSNSLSTVAPF